MVNKLFALVLIASLGFGLVDSCDEGQKEEYPHQHSALRGDTI